MKYKEMRPHELAQMTVRDIQRRRKNKEEGIKQANLHVLCNRERIQRKLSHGRY